ncbi:hypothetical protein EV714DRAFT_265916 [Schizophyllum commune]
MAYKSYFVTQADSPWLIMDRTNLVGVLLSLSFLTAQALVACRSSTSKATRAHALPLLVNVAFVFSCGTVNYAANIALNVHMFVENRLYLHGPNAYLLEHYDNEFNVLYNASYVAANILVEALLLYRCFVVWSDKKWIVAIPAVIYLASTVMSCLFLYQIIETSLRQSTALRIAAAYFLITFSVTPFLTLLIAGRLLAMSKRVKETLGAEHARTYTGIAALVVESAAPYALTYFAFIIAYCLRSAGANVLDADESATLWSIAAICRPSRPRLASGSMQAAPTATALKDARRSSTSNAWSVIAPVYLGTSISPAHLLPVRLSPATAA